MWPAKPHPVPLYLRLANQRTAAPVTASAVAGPVRRARYEFRRTPWFFVFSLLKSLLVTAQANRENTITAVRGRASTAPPHRWQGNRI